MPLPLMAMHPGKWLTARVVAAVNGTAIRTSFLLAPQGADPEERQRGTLVKISQSARIRDSRMANAFFASNAAALGQDALVTYGLIAKRFLERKE